MQMLGELGRWGPTMVALLPHESWGKKEPGLSLLIEISLLKIVPAGLLYQQPNFLMQRSE